MNNTEKNEILEAIGNLHSKFDTMQIQICEMKKEVEKIPEMQEQLKAIPEMQKELKAIPEMKEELRRISRSVAKIEVEHGERLAALFDAFDVHAERLESHEKRIEGCEKHIENQGDQIYYLKSKVQGL